MNPSTMTRRALLIGVPGGGINVGLAAERLTPVLTTLGFTIERRTDNRATRAGILAGLDRLIELSEPGDAVFIHYFGHGGRVQFTDVDTDQVFGYVTCTKSLRGAFEAVLDVELSARLSELDARCGNVTIMLDCCFSAELVRSGEPDVPLASHRLEPAPAWAAELSMLSMAPKVDLALDSHPRIVRLCAASPKREGFAAVRGGRHIGRLTEAFLAALEEVGEDWTKLCWDTFSHRLREHVVEALAMEGQWVALAGPRSRRLFSTQTVELPGSVGFVPSDEPGVGWLRAGWQQGVGVGDRWAILDPRVDEAPRILVEATVSAVERNRATLQLAATSEPLRAGMPAIVLGLHEPLAVEVEDPAWIASSAWVRAADSASARVRREGEALIVEDLAGTRPPLRVLDSARALALLEERARVEALDRSLAGQDQSECPLVWSWSLIDAPGRALPDSGATLHAGDRIRVDLRLPADAPPFNWFVSLVLVDVAGQLRLLSTRMPEGIELAPGDAEVVGVRLGRRGAQGIELRWAAEVEADEGPASLRILASRRPIELAHIVRPQALDDDDALALQGLTGETMRDRKPEHTRGCAWGRFDFCLRRSPRTD